MHYLALGIGLIGASQIGARALDWTYGYLTTRNGGKGKPEYRLRKIFYGERLPPKVSNKSSLHAANMIPGTIVLPIGLLLNGWSAQHRVAWIGPDIVRDLHSVEFLGLSRKVSGNCIDWRRDDIEFLVYTNICH